MDSIDKKIDARPPDEQGEFWYDILRLSLDDKWLAEHHVDSLDFREIKKIIFKEQGYDLGYNSTAA